MLLRVAGERVLVWLPAQVVGREAYAEPEWFQFCPDLNPSPSLIQAAKNCCSAAYWLERGWEFHERFP